jgi:hypothetical protein
MYIERCETKISNAEVTPQAIWPIAKSLLKERIFFHFHSVTSNCTVPLICVGVVRVTSCHYLLLCLSSRESCRIGRIGCRPLYKRGSKGE